MPLLASTMGLLEPEYGYVLAVAVSSALVNQWHGINVGKYRKKAGIKYPACYADNALAEKDPAANQFNCAQRAHANYVEQLPNFLVYLTVAGIRYPTYAAIAGAIWLGGRIHYAIGYSTGDPKARMQGAWQYLGLFGLLGLASTTTYKVITGSL